MTKRHECGEGGIATSHPPVLRFPGDDKQHGDDGQQEEHEEEGGGSRHGAHAAHHDQVEDEDQEVEESHHLHDEHAGLLGRWARVHPREDGRTEVRGGLARYTQ